MSIVIGVLVPNKGVFIYADRKWVKRFSNGRIHSQGNMKKVRLISNNVACGFTGNAKWGISLFEKLRTFKDKKASELIDIIKSDIYDGNDEGSTFTLIGTYDDDKPFAFGYETSGTFCLRHDQDYYGIVTSSTSLNEKCSVFFFHELDKHEDIDEACIKTIKYASEQSPQSISEACDGLYLPFTE